MSSLRVGLLCYTDLQVAARIPHPTPSGPPSPRGKALGVAVFWVLINIDCIAGDGNRPGSFLTAGAIVNPPGARSA